jgi:hypothetical protein
MAGKYDAETTKLMDHAIEDLQYWMASAGADTTEAAVSAWQQGYIAGVNRAINFSSSTETEEED